MGRSFTFASFHFSKCITNLLMFSYLQTRTTKRCLVPCYETD